ncbi:MAG: hypothetical protein E6H63_18240, partial [Betaproteobacteria bacterium]
MRFLLPTVDSASAAGYVPRWLRILLALGTLAFVMQGHAWPERPVRVIATSPPGGAVDLLARIVADEFAKEYGQPFVVENRPGANGNIGVAAALQASADGHMLFVAPPGPFSINAQLMPSTRFDARADIAPIALLGVSPLVLAVHPSVPAANLRELIAWLKAQHGRVSYASQAV